MQEERSGSSSDSVYKSNWPYFLLLHFMRSQFKTRPTSGNIKKTCESTEEQTENTCLEEPTGNYENIVIEENINDISTDDLNKTQRNEESNDGGNVSATAGPEGPSSSKDNTATKGLVHPNNFNKRRAQNQELKKLIQIEERKMAILEEKRAKRAEQMPDDDMLFFQSLLPHMKNINGADKLFFRNEVQNVVLKYAYKNDLSRPSTSNSGSTRQSFVSSDISLPPTRPATPQDNNILDLDQWSQGYTYSYK